MTLLLVVIITTLAIITKQGSDISVADECIPNAGTCATMAGKLPFCCSPCPGGNKCLPQGWGNCTQYCNSLGSSSSSSSGSPPPTTTDCVSGGKSYSPGTVINRGCGATPCVANQKRLCTCQNSGSWTCSCVASNECTGGGNTGDACTSPYDCKIGLSCCSCNKCSSGTDCASVCNPTPPPTSSSGGSSGGGGGITCAPPNKARGDQCNPLCTGNSACDFDAPLECRACTMNAADAARGCHFEKEGKNVCMNGPTDSGACGAIIGCTDCTSSNSKPVNCGCVNNNECASGYCDPIAETCQTNPNPPTDPCSLPEGRPAGCSCGGDNQCSTNFCQPSTSQCEINPNSGCTGKFNVYRCFRNVIGLGCQDNVLATNVDHPTASGLVASTPACAVTQADCIGTSGGEGALTKNNWTAACEPTTSSGTPPPTSSGGNTSSGTPPPTTSSGNTSSGNTSSGTTSSGSSSGSSSSGSSSGVNPPPVVEQCNFMQRVPSTTPVQPGTALTFTVSYDSTSQLGTTRLYMLNSLGQEVSSVATIGVINPSGSTFEYTYPLTIPSGTANGNYDFRFSKTGAVSDLDTTPSCMLTVEVYTPPIVESCIYLTRNPNDAQVSPGTNFTVQVRYSAGQVYENSRVFLTGPASTTISSVATPTGPFTNNEYNYDFTLQVPSDAQNGDYQLRFSPSGLGNDLVQTPVACTNSVNVYSPVVANRCIMMDRTPADLTLAPNTPINVVVTDESQTAYPGSGLFLLDGQNNQIAHAISPIYANLGNNQHQYTFSITLPSGVDNGNYFFRYSRTNNINDLVTNTECTNTVTLETPPPPFVNQCIYMQRNPIDAEVNAGQGFNVIVRYSSQTQLGGSMLYLFNSGGQAIASTTTNQVTQTDINQYDYSFTIQLPAGVSTDNYNFRFSPAGPASGIIETPTACTEQVTLNPAAPAVAVLSLQTNSSFSCTVDHGAVVNTTISIANPGEVAGTIDYVQNNLPSQVTSTNQIISISPVTNSTSTSQINWNTPRTINPGDVIIYHYNLIFSQSELSAMVDGQLTSSTIVQYDSNTGQNLLTSTSILTNMDSCVAAAVAAGQGLIPDTGLFDHPETLVFIGVVLILGGVFVNRSGPVFKLLGKDIDPASATAELVEDLVPTDAFGEFTHRVAKQSERKAKRQKRKK